MTLTGWLLMGIVWLLIISFTIYTLYRSLSLENKKNGSETGKSDEVASLLEQNAGVPERAQNPPTNP